MGRERKILGRKFSSQNYWNHMNNSLGMLFIARDVSSISIQSIKPHFPAHIQHSSSDTAQLIDPKRAARILGNKKVISSAPVVCAFGFCCCVYYTATYYIGSVLSRPDITQNFALFIFIFIISERAPDWVTPIGFKFDTLRRRKKIGIRRRHSAKINIRSRSGPRRKPGNKAVNGETGAHRTWQH